MDEKLAILTGDCSEASARIMRTGSDSLESETGLMEDDDRLCLKTHNREREKPWAESAA
jgi:hypothetical protein